MVLFNKLDFLTNIFTWISEKSWKRTASIKSEPKTLTVQSKASDMTMSTVTSTESLVQCDMPDYFEPSTFCYNQMSLQSQPSHHSHNLQQNQYEAAVSAQQDYNQMVFYNNELKSHQAMNHHHLDMDFYYISDTVMAYHPVNQHTSNLQQPITTLPSFNTFLD